MKNVYVNLKAGKSKEEALRLAKDALKRQRTTAADLQRGLTVLRQGQARQEDSSHPFYWAPFILIGEWD